MGTVTFFGQNYIVPLKMGREFEAEELNINKSRKFRLNGFREFLGYHKHVHYTGLAQFKSIDLVWNILKTSQNILFLIRFIILFSSTNHLVVKKKLNLEIL